MPFDPNALTNAHLDLDFRDDPNYVFGDLGAPLFAAGADPTIPLIPRDQWRTLADKMQAENSGLEWLVTRIYDQKNEGSCVANACSQAVQIMYAAQHGKENVVQLSAISLYKRIGRSPSSGAMVSDGLEESAERGILPLDTPANRAKFGEAVMPNTGFREPFPSDWENTAKHFRVTEWWTIRTVDQLISALFQGFPVVVGREGHSICYCRPFYKGSALCCLYANSWRESWGVEAGDMPGGFGVDTEAKIRKSSSWAFCPRSIVPMES